MFKKPFAKRRRSLKNSLEPIEPRIAPATFTVTNLNDLGPGSLRDAIAQADGMMGADTIDFQAGLTGTITLASTLTVADSVSILGPGAANLSISGNDTVQAFSAANVDLTIQDVTIEHGAGTLGGAIHSEGGGLVLENVSLHDNKATNGGAVYVRGSAGTILIEHSTVTGNSTTGKGGGVFLYALSGPSVTVNDTTISGNQSSSRGGGLFLYKISSGTLSIDHTTISGNQTNSRGGGAFLYRITSPTASITDSTISGNSSANRGGGLFLYKVSVPLEVQRTTISGNHATGAAGSGGGVFLYKTSGVTFEDSTISGNTSAVGGSGIHSYRDVTAFVLRNSTVSGNSGPGAAIELQVSPGATVQNSTITANTSTGPFAGIHSDAEGGVVIQSTILSGNTGTTTDDLSGSFTLDHSLVQHPGSATIIDGGGNIFNQDPMLGALANNGGPTQTHALLLGSPAIDHGSNPANLTFDQRGTGFLRSTNTGPDIGAFELQPPDLSITKTSPQASYSPGDTVTYTFNVQNVGSSDAMGVTISDPVLAQTTFNAAENAGWSLVNGAYVYSVGSVAANSAAAPVTLTLHVTPTVPQAFTALTNMATVADDGTYGPEIVTSNNTATETDTISANSVLHISVDDNISKTVAHGGTIIYTLKYSNTGNRDAAVTLVEHPGPATFFTPVGSTSGWHFNPGLSQYEFSVSDLLAGDGDHTVTFAVQTSTFIPTSVRTITDSVEIQEVPAAQEQLLPAAVNPMAHVDTLVYQGIEVFTPGVALPGHYATAQVRIIDIALQKAGLPAEVSFTAYPNNIRDSFRTALADFNNDGFDDVLIISEHGKAGVKIFDGTTGALLDSPLNGLKPFGANKGAFVAIPKQGQSPGLIEQSIPGGGSIADVVFGSSLGGGAIRYYSPTDGGLQLTFYPFGRGFTGGVRVATGDVNGDGVDDLIAAQGNFGNVVKVYNDGDPGSLLGTFRVGGRYAGGLNISVGDLDHDGRAEIVAGHNRLSAPVVEIFDFQTNDLLAVSGGTFVKLVSFDAFARSFKQGVRVAVADVDLDGNLDVIAAVGFNGKSQVTVFSLSQQQPPLLSPVLTPTPLTSFAAFPNLPQIGVWVSATTPVPSVPFFSGGGGGS